MNDCSYVFSIVHKVNLFSNSSSSSAWQRFHITVKYFHLTRNAKQIENTCYIILIECQKETIRPLYILTIHTLLSWWGIFYISEQVFVLSKGHISSTSTLQPKIELSNPNIPPSPSIHHQKTQNAFDTNFDKIP